MCFFRWNLEKMKQKNKEKKTVFEVIRHENLQKGRNEGRPKTVKKDKQTKFKSYHVPFFLAVVALMSSLAKHSSFGQMWSMREYAP